MYISYFGSLVKSCDGVVYGLSIILWLVMMKRQTLLSHRRRPLDDNAFLLSYKPQAKIPLYKGMSMFYLAIKKKYNNKSE